MSRARRRGGKLRELDIFLAIAKREVRHHDARPPREVVEPTLAAARLRELRGPTAVRASCTRTRDATLPTVTSLLASAAECRPR